MCICICVCVFVLLMRVCLCACAMCLCMCSVCACASMRVLLCVHAHGCWSYVYAYVHVFMQILAFHFSFFYLLSIGWRISPSHVSDLGMFIFTLLNTCNIPPTMFRPLSGQAYIYCAPNLMCGFGQVRVSPCYLVCFFFVCACAQARVCIIS